MGESAGRQHDLAGSGDGISLLRLSGRSQLIDIVMPASESREIPCISLQIPVSGFFEIHLTYSFLR